MNKLATIEAAAPYAAEQIEVFSSPRHARHPALGDAFRIVAGDLRCVLARLGVLAEIAEAHRSCRGEGGSQDVLRRLDDMLSAVIANTRRTGDPLGFRSGVSDLHDVLGLALRLNRPLAESRAVSLVEDSARPVTIAGDRKLLLEAADILVASAIRRSPHGGRVTTMAELRGGRALLHVADEGDTLTETGIARCLRPFSDEVEPRRRGAGPLRLDLWFARLIAERHGGGIAARLPVGGRGNLFTLAVTADLH